MQEIKFKKVSCEHKQKKIQKDLENSQLII